MAVLIPLITWFAILQGLSFCIYPFLTAYLPHRTACYSLSKTMGLFTFGYIVWVLGLMQCISITTPQLIVVLLGILLSTHLFVKKCFGEWSSIPYPDAKDIETVEWLFIGSFLIFYTLQMFHPEIYWGEKPMDFTFLNFFTRQTELPPQDPWAAGNTMNYYYFGSFLFGLLHKLSGLSPTYGFGVSIATVAALFVTSLFAALSLTIRSSLTALIGALSIAGLGTYDGLYLWLIAKKPPFGFDLYWATSRTFHEPGINEYPLWTTLFADLHAHFIALPVAASLVSAVTISIDRLRKCDQWRGFSPVCLLTGFLWGLLATVNTWDFITYGVVIGLVYLFFCFTPDREASLRDRGWIALAGISTLFIGIVASLPFHLSVTSGAKVQWGYVYPEEYNQLLNILRIHGHWILLFIISSITLFLTKREKDSILQKFFALILGLFPIGMGLAHIYVHEIPSAPWGVLSITTILCLSGAFLFHRSSSITSIATALFVYSAGFLMTMMELHFLMDRMNTTFKINNAVWVTLGVAACSAFALSMDLLKDRMQARKLFIAGAATVVAPALFATGMMIWIMCTFVRIPGPRPAFDGTAYLSLFNPVEKQAYDWIQKNIPGTPTMVEAVGPSYQEYTRFSMNTGLPVVLGWEYHVMQRGTTDGAQRKSDVDTIYSTTELKEALKLLNKYQVDLIVVGKQERMRYSVPGLAKFEQHPEAFPLLFSAEENGVTVKIFTTTYSNLSR